MNSVTNDKSSVPKGVAAALVAASICSDTRSIRVTPEAHHRPLDFHKRSTWNTCTVCYCIGPVRFCAGQPISCLHDFRFHPSHSL